MLLTGAKDLFKGLSMILGEGCFKTEREVTAVYAVDDVVPGAVIFPKNIEEIVRVVRFANDERLVIVPRGSGTKMGMGNPPERLDIVVSTERLNHMKDVDSANLTITVESGVKFRDIQARLATEEDRCYLPLGDLGTGENEIICSDRSHCGSFLPIDPPFSGRATIGGIIASNSSGPRRLLYGLPRDIVLGVRFVAPGGKIIGAGGKTVKNVSGYDISKLMIGSMGSLGILCEMTMKLLPLPEKMETLLISFSSLNEAVRFVKSIFETSLLPAAVEVMNREAMICAGPESTRNLADGEFVVAIALEAFKEAVERMKRVLSGMARDCGAESKSVIDEDDHLRFWMRVGDLSTGFGERYPDHVTAQFNYPISNWDEVASFFVDNLNKSSVPYAFLIHSGSGISVVDMGMESGSHSSRKKACGIIAKLFKKCLDVQGNMVIRHAPVVLKRDLPVWGKPCTDILIMKGLRNQLDPSGVMNPGRFV